MWSWSRSPGQPQSSTAAWGPPAPITRSAGEDPWDSARSFPRSPVSKLVPDEREAYRPGCRNLTKTRALSRGFPRESGHFGICRKVFWPRHDSSHTVTARDGLTAPACVCGRRPHGAVIVTALGPDALVCGGQRAADPPWRGRLAQRESASFTPRRSLVRSQYRPPGISPGQRLQDRPHPPSRDGAFRLLERNLGDQLLLASDGRSGLPEADVTQDAALAATVHLALGSALIGPGTARHQEGEIALQRAISPSC